MSESQTPRTDEIACPFNDLPSEEGSDEVVPADFARQLESELTLANERITSKQQAYEQAAEELTATRARLAELEGIAEKLKTFQNNHGLQHSGICAYRPGQLNMECTCGCDDLYDVILAYKEGKK